MSQDKTAPAKDAGRGVRRDMGRGDPLPTVTFGPSRWGLALR